MTKHLLRTLIAVALAASATLTGSLASAADSHTFRWSYQGDVNSLDPMVLSESFTLGFQFAFYEPLVAYDEDLNLTPALAVSWENPEPTKWVFHLREGVKFHDGSPFSADDVIFSWQRSLSPNSQLKGYTGIITDVRKIDAHTVEMTTAEPAPILPRNLVLVYMMSKTWAQQHDTMEAASVTGDDNYANLHENGTGPFVVTERQPDIRTVLSRFDDYWDDQLPTNVDRVVFQPIKQESTRVAALLSGDMDLVQPIPVQDWPRLENTAGIELLRRPETRALFIGFDQFRDELLYSNVKGKNPFKDRRVREAVARAIDAELIDKKIMRGAGAALGTIIAPSVNGWDPAFARPYAQDVEQAKKLLAQAGYPDGFKVTLDCPNDRYVNDEKICEAVVTMLARIGIDVDLLAQTKSKFFGKVLLTGGNDTSMYLFGWAPITVDAENALTYLVACRDSKTGAGQSNLGHYCNPEIDALIAKIRVETDQAQRNALIKQALLLLRQDFAYIPLVQPPLSWGVREGIAVQQRADSFLDMRHVVLP